MTTTNWTLEWTACVTCGCPFLTPDPVRYRSCSLMCETEAMRKERELEATPVVHWDALDTFEGWAC